MILCMFTMLHNYVHISLLLKHLITFDFDSRSLILQKVCEFRVKTKDRKKERKKEVSDINLLKSKD